MSGRRASSTSQLGGGLAQMPGFSVAETCVRTNTQLTRRAGLDLLVS
jgi:hypothetical protein